MITIYLLYLDYFRLLPAAVDYVLAAALLFKSYQLINSYCSNNSCHHRISIFAYDRCRDTSLYKAFNSMVTEGPLWEETHKKNQVRQQAYPSFTPIHDDLTCTTTTTTYWYICHNTEPPTTQLLLLQPRNQDTNQRCQQPHNRSHQQQPWPTARQKHQTRHRNPTTQTTTTASEQKIISATSNQPHTDPSLKLPQPKTNPTHQHTRPPTCWAHETATEPTSSYPDNSDIKHNNDSFRTNQQTTSTSTQDPTLTFSTQELPLVLKKTHQLTITQLTHYTKTTHNQSTTTPHPWAITTTEHKKPPPTRKNTYSHNIHLHTRYNPSYSHPRPKSDWSSNYHTKPTDQPSTPTQPINTTITPTLRQKYQFSGDQKKSTPTPYTTPHNTTITYNLHSMVAIHRTVALWRARGANPSVDSECIDMGSHYPGG